MTILPARDVTDLSDPATSRSQTGERLTEYLEDADGALSGNTVRALKADLERFAAWCAERAVAPLPARAATLVAYIEAMASERAPATVRRYVSSIAAVHKAAGEPSPLDRVTVRRALQRMHRRKGCRQRQVKGLTWTLRRRLMEAAGDRVIDARNRAILAVAYDAMLRRSELVAVQVVDVTMDRGGSASLLVRRAKTDPVGGGAILYLHRDSVKLLKEWLSASGIARGAALPFRAQERHGGRKARCEPGAAHLQGDGRTGRAPGTGRAPTLRAQPTRGRGSGHDRQGDRDPRNHAGRALEERPDGAALRRAAARQAEWRRPAGTASETQMSPENALRLAGHKPCGRLLPITTIIRNYPVI